MSKSVVCGQPSVKNHSENFVCYSGDNLTDYYDSSRTASA